MRWRQPQVTHTKHRRSAYHLKRAWNNEHQRTLVTCKHVKLSWGKPEMSLEEAAVPGGSSCPMEWSKLSKWRSWGQMSFRSHACPTFWTKEVPLMCECLPSAASNPGLASEHKPRSLRHSESLTSTKWHTCINIHIYMCIYIQITHTHTYLCVYLFISICLFICVFIFNAYNISFQAQASKVSAGQENTSGAWKLVKAHWTDLTNMTRASAAKSFKHTSS